MRTITVFPEQDRVDALLTQAMQENIILKTIDGREFLLAELDDFEHEIELTRENQDLMRLLDERRQEVASISLAEVRERLGI